MDIIEKFKSLHRPFRYGALFFVLIIAVTLTVCLLPTQPYDSSGDVTDNYHVTGGTLDSDYSSLGSAFSAVNSNGGTDFTITVIGNDHSVSSFILNTGKNVTLRSSDDIAFTLTISAGRHGTVNGSLTLENIILHGNDKAGGIMVNTSGTLTMNDKAAIQHCHVVGDNGGGVNSKGTVIMNSGSTVSNNKTSWDGGGVYVTGIDSSFKTGLFIMNGGIIDNNVAGRDGGGVDGIIYSTITLNGGTISNNTASAGDGGGVYNGLYSNCTMNADMVISENTVIIQPYDNNEGGGLFCDTQSNFTMYGGTISKNTSQSGGGVMVISGGMFTMYGGTICNNTADWNGGGVCSHGTFIMKDGLINKNKSNSKAWLCGGGGVYIEGGGPFTMDGGTISDNDATDYGGGVMIRNDVHDTSEFIMNGGTICGNTAAYGGGVTIISWTYDPCEFTMNNGMIDNNTASEGGGIYISFGVFTLFDGTICGNTATSYGGGVAAVNESGDPWEFTMNGGKVCNNEAYFGGGAFVSYGVFTLFDGKICSNNAAYGGGVFNNGDAVSNLVKGTICDNEAYFGGGVCNAGKLSMSSGANILNNYTTDDGYGGGVCSYSNAVFNMTGGKISGNTAGYYGGGVCDLDNSTSNIGVGSVISDNTAYCGGGFYSDATLNVTGGTICNNTAEGSDNKGSGGGIYTTNFAKLSVKDGVVFSGNTAPTLRTENIDPVSDIDGNKTPDLKDYENKIGAVVLDALVNIGQNAPAYNNYDINYLGGSYIVFVDIEADGTGSVTITDSKNGKEYGTLAADGCVYVPITADSIALSATPIDAYLFKQFTVDITLVSSDDSIVVPIKGNMHVIAEFEPEPIPTNPHEEHKHYIIKAAADGGSTIIPKGEVSVGEGKDKTFTFSAKSGYSIIEVLVDGVAISSGDLASGKYTFSDVKRDHTIYVTSKSGYPPISDGGGSNSGGGENKGEGDSGGEWAVLNLICAVIAIFAGLIAIAAGWNRRRKEEDDDEKKNSEIDEDERKRSKTALLLRVLALIVGIVSVIVFFL
ncbi:MAG: hypothetical protein LBG63_06145, partial [Candidatus Methanoplasma sp.]|nr:hypothetical protein [Candidatus Methanoplasma sp.]